MIEKIQYKHLRNCLRLSNSEVELVVTTDVGPRIIFYGFKNGENILGEHFDAKVETTLGEFKPYGGHRLWIAPEHMPNSYAPDNIPVEAEIDEKKNAVRLVQAVETVTKTRKEIKITLDETGSGAAVEHLLTNCGESEIEVAAWALTIMRGGGVCEVPNEPFAAYGAETLLPIRNLTVWSYTDFTDPRWRLGKEFIRLKVDSQLTEPQKIGVLNKQGWAAYDHGDTRFIKWFEYIEGAVYPDMNSNTELYTAGDFVEIESLAPLCVLAPGDSTTHAERWELKPLDKSNR